MFWSISMVSIFSLFSKSPFGPIQKHMQMVDSCVRALSELLVDLTENSGDKVMELAEKVSKLEHDADLIKNDIRDHLPTSLFMPVDRRDLLEVITNIDAIADVAEDTARLIVMRRMEFPEELKPRFKEFTEAVFSTSSMAHNIVVLLDDLLASSFAGSQSEKVLNMIKNLGQEEHRADIAGEKLLQEMFKIEDRLKPLDIIWWLKIFGKLGDVANASEKMVNRLRLFMSK
jgi:predicted phosphate transport protein (TIGR00153 family)